MGGRKCATPQLPAPFPPHPVKAIYAYNATNLIYYLAHPLYLLMVFSMQHAFARTPKAHIFISLWLCAYESTRQERVQGWAETTQSQPKQTTVPWHGEWGCACVRACLLNRVCVCIQLRSVLSSRNNLPLRIFNPQVTALHHLALYLTLTHLIYIFYTLIHTRAGLSGLGVSWCIASQNSLA